MKAINLFLLVAVFALGACDSITKKSDEAEATSAIDSTIQLEPAVVESIVPVGYVQYFDQAITALEQGDQATTLSHLQSGINALMEKGQSLEGEAKHKLDTAIAELEAAKLQLQQGQLQGATALKQVIFQVQANTPHPLLADAPAAKTTVPE